MLYSLFRSLEIVPRVRYAAPNQKDLKEMNKLWYFVFSNNELQLANREISPFQFIEFIPLLFSQRSSASSDLEILTWVAYIKING